MNLVEVNIDIIAKNIATNQLIKNDITEYFLVFVSYVLIFELSVVLKNFMVIIYFSIALSLNIPFGVKKIVNQVKTENKNTFSTNPQIFVCYLSYLSGNKRKEI